MVLLNEFGRPGGSVTRRGFLHRTAGAGMLGSAAAISAGCATSGGGGNKSVGHKAATRKNPLGVKADAPLAVYIFKGGDGDAYAKFDVKMFTHEFPKAHITYRADPGIETVLQKLFVQGKPPDVVPYTSDFASLIADGRIADLTGLLDAPAFDTPGKSVRETLLPNVVETGTFGKKPYVLNYTSEVFGVWYSRSLFEQRGWDYPHTWDAMLALCRKIKKAGIAPWTFQGKYPGYVVSPLLAMAGKAGGPDVLKSIDNLVPNAWHHESVEMAAARFQELVQKKYILPGSSGLTNTQSQLYWTQHKAAFIPCGSWLENEMSTITPTGFDMVIAPTPSISASDAMPFEAIQSGPAGGFIVPEQATNKYGGLEFLRIMLSQKASKEYSRLTHSLTSVSGYADGMTISSGFSSCRDAVSAAGTNALWWQFSAWYPKLEIAVEAATGELMADRIDPGEWVKRCQKAADDTAKDSTVTKYTR
ncbi:MAG TPA: N-acetylglucosamine/diacetylchitobiose ABC transporter substrate-binding protein [Mycobacteriales bacterium]|nr:N-acetylglucosamine/diacetylchitobiose ABC transporter substrate-binding protein [Mycobacteriales bacterium]